MIGLPLKEPVNLFYVLASNLSNIKVNAGGRVLLFYYLNLQELTLPDILNRLITTQNHNLSNNNSTSIIDLLLNTGKVQEWQRVDLNDGQCKNKDIQASLTLN